MNMSALFDKLISHRQDDTAMTTTNSMTEPNNGSTATLKPVNNQFTKLLTITKFLPANVRAKILSSAFGKIVPFVGTVGIYYETVAPDKVVVSLENDKKVQNHIGSVHAVAVTLLAETATGFILGLNLPSDRVLLVKSYNVNFYRPLKKGQVAAVATLSDEQRLDILNTPKGEMVIPCYIEDRSIEQQDKQRDPITVEMTWAWIPKQQLQQRQSGQVNTISNLQEASSADKATDDDASNSLAQQADDMALIKNESTNKS